jgi:hypothetical protein
MTRINEASIVMATGWIGLGALVLTAIAAFSIGLFVKRLLGDL